MTTGSPAAPRFLRFLAWLVPAFLLVAVFAIVLVLVMSGISGFPGLFVGIVAGGCLVMGVLLVYWNLVDWINLRIIRRTGRAEQAHWEDGAVVAMEGIVRVDGEPLVSPFSATPCAAYTYVISTRRTAPRERSIRVVIAQGFHMLRSTIDGTGHSLQLFALPGFSDDLRRIESGTTWGDEARRLVESLGDKAPAAGQGEILSRLLEAQHVDTEEVRRDYRMSSIGKHADGLTIQEEVLPIGRTVCIVGTYDRQRNGLTARRSRIGPNLMVYPGSAGEVVARVGKDLAWFARAAVVLVGIGLATVAYATVPRDAGAPATGGGPSSEASSDNGAPLDPEAAYFAQVDAGAKREFAAGNTARAFALAVNADAAATVRWLIEQGVSPDTPIVLGDDASMLAIVEASRQGHLATIEALLDGGADPNAAEPQRAGATAPRTALGEALANGHCDVAALLERAGARRPAGAVATPCR